jgi:O-antigen ligase
LRDRVILTLQPDYYSNAERLQMCRAGLRMIWQHPFLGVGAGRVQRLYPQYLGPGESVPAYHGHLHNSAIQLAAQFGLPVLACALLLCGVWLCELLRGIRQAVSVDARFLARSGLLGMVGFLISGMTDYAYGHALVLIVLSFVAIGPLVPLRTAEAAAR